MTDDFHEAYIATPTEKRIFTQRCVNAETGERAIMINFDGNAAILSPDEARTIARSLVKHAVVTERKQRGDRQ